MSAARRMARVPESMAEHRAFINRADPEQPCLRGVQRPTINRQLVHQAPAFSDLEDIKAVCFTMCPRQTFFDRENTDFHEAACVNDLERCLSVAYG